MRQDFSPVAQNERMAWLDGLRGFAVFGILAANYFQFGWPQEMMMIGRPDPLTGPNLFAFFLVEFLVRSKFYSLFSFMFGVGLAIQMERCDARGISFLGFGTRRLLILLGLGLVHMFVIWTGDILTYYALMGIILVMMIRLPPLVLAVLGVLSCAFFGLLLVGYIAMIMAMNPAEVNEQVVIGFEDYHKGIEVLGSGSWFEGFAYRVDQGFSNSVSIILMGWIIIGLFLLGAAAQRSGFLRRLEQPGRGMRLLFWTLLAVALPLNLGFAFTRIMSPMVPADLYSLYGVMMQTPGQIIGAAAMVVGFAQFRGAFTRWFEPVGRMALTNYIAQSVVFTFIFYSWGLGLMGKLDEVWVLVLCPAFFVLQVFVSRAYLKSHNQGPLEAFWRKLSYAGIEYVTPAPAPVQDDTFPDTHPHEALASEANREAPHDQPELGGLHHQDPLGETLHGDRKGPPETL